MAVRRGFTKRPAPGNSFHSRRRARRIPAWFRDSDGVLRILPFVVRHARRRAHSKRDVASAGGLRIPERERVREPSKRRRYGKKHQGAMESNDAESHVRSNPSHDRVRDVASTSHGCRLTDWRKMASQCGSLFPSFISGRSAERSQTIPLDVATDIRVTTGSMNIHVTSTEIFPSSNNPCICGTSACLSG